MISEDSYSSKKSVGQILSQPPSKTTKSTQRDQHVEPQQPFSPCFSFGVDFPSLKSTPKKSASKETSRQPTPQKASLQV